ncbi:MULTISPECIES: 5' DNA nuclease [unclassified Rhizobium]|uniref:5' DNA nuclease n=1 Tax=unclassified Rhizobium TaxID=2613769 RepID=UPI000DDEA51C|nr:MULTISPECIES: 5' DNA nuclease [unclassified Rhizobium]MBB3290264.1 NADH-quinone oxidoreductase subunit E [Rhizobium sp. BK252]MBB3405045.1 NADH-quinone oxidoreductase subunit E [Rhizobium sp. BK289]MBB3417591.1 NADH-quinone oxidoreductase subunit E [Rhizobium sp. BK284]MBB3485470.1 NADH-quinone oxidoreductase subunit E [Rhizobium sp. BK347]MDK4719922.1 5' DNA nuclease [Rhizobium sp. CNPSo 3968]
MAKIKDIRQGSGATDHVSVDFGRIAADMLRDSPAMPIHPLMAHPAAAFAAAAAIGFGVTSQIAGAFFGAFQGAVEAASKRAAEPGEEKDVLAAAEPTARKEGAGEVKPVKASPAAKPVVSKPAAVKPKPAVAKRAEAKPVAAAEIVTAPAKSKAPAERKAKAEVVAPIAAKPAPVRSRKAAVKADDLKRISGVGPKLEQVLNGRGIRRFADIAAWSDADIERIDTELGFDGRIRRDDWVGQAKALLPKGRS